MPLDPNTAATAPLFPAVGEAGFNDKAYTWAQYFQSAFGDAAALYADQLTLPATVTFDQVVAGLSTGGAENLATPPRLVALDSSRNLIVFAVSTSIYAVVIDESAGTVGTAVLVSTTAGGISYADGILSATNQVLVVYGYSTILAGVTLTISGSSITVNTAGIGSQTLAGAISDMTDLLATPTGYVVQYARATSVVAIRGITVTGTTVNFGAETTLTGTGCGGYDTTPTSGVILAYSYGTTSVSLTPITCSGTTLTPATATTLTTATTTGVLAQKFASGAFIVAALGGSSIAVYNISGTTLTQQGTTNTSVSSITSMAVFANQAIVVGSTTSNVISSAGAAGTAVTFAGISTANPFAVASDGIWLVTGGLATSDDLVNRAAIKVGINGSNPSVLKRRHVNAVFSSGTATGTPRVLTSRLFQFGVNAYASLHGRGLQFHAAQVSTGNVQFSALANGDVLALISDEPAFRRIHPAHQWGTLHSNASLQTQTNISRTAINNVWSFAVLDATRVSIRKVVFS